VGEAQSFDRRVADDERHAEGLGQCLQSAEVLTESPITVNDMRYALPTSPRTAGL
jgi:hypothetical protein